MWNRSKSILLSIFCTRLFMVLVVAAVCFAPYIAAWYFGGAAWAERYYLPFRVTIYLCAAPALVVLALLDRLLLNIRRQKVFVPQNVKLLRVISWACIAVGLAAFGGGFSYASFFIVAAVAAFCGLIVRVVKNVFDQAIEIKTENDFTI